MNGTQTHFFDHNTTTLNNQTLNTQENYSNTYPEYSILYNNINNNENITE